MAVRSFVCALGFALLLIADLMFSSPSVALAADLTAGEGAVVTTDLLNLRAGPSAANPVIDILPRGTGLRLLAEPTNEVWWRVTDGTRVGYVSREWLEPGDAPEGTEAFDLDLPVPFHRQMTSVWCEAADIQSWAEYQQGEPIGLAYDVQQEIWDWELENNLGFTVDEWNASPFATASAARQWMSDRGFNHFTYDDVYQATWVMAWLLASPEYREPSIALIWDGAHYVLVRGFRATADPSKDPEAEILGVYVMDPNQGGRSWMGEDRYVPMDEWVERYLTPITYLTPHTGAPDDVWQDRVVTIQRDWEDIGPTPEGRLNATVEDYSTTQHPKDVG